jgi:hypothetical protein
MDSNQLDAATRRPETVMETESEVQARDRTWQLYAQSGYGPIGDYEAGWKAAKAYYREWEG